VTKTKPKRLQEIRNVFSPDPKTYYRSVTLANKRSVCCINGFTA